MRGLRQGAQLPRKLEQGTVVTIHASVLRIHMLMYRVPHICPVQNHETLVFYAMAFNRNEISLYTVLIRTRTCH